MGEALPAHIERNTAMSPSNPSSRSLASALTRRQVLVTGIATAALSASGLALAQKPTGRVLRVGHQKGWLSILKGRGTLEKELAPLGVSVTWTEFNAGPVQLEAMNVGAIDFGDVGEAPPIFAQAAGAPLVYAGATVPRPKLEAIVVPKDSAIKSVLDLKGKRVAYNKGSNVQYFLAKLLEKNGLQYTDVQHIHLPPPDARRQKDIRLHGRQRDAPDPDRGRRHLPRKAGGDHGGYDTVLPVHRFKRRRRRLRPSEDV